MSGFTQIEFATLANWAAQTGVWVSALLLFVLVIRRPFARAFGARAAYALWALPALRLVMPQITLPAWLNPNPAHAQNFQTPFEVYQPLESGATLSPKLGGFDIAISAGLIIWSLGILIFLALQWRAHYRFHHDMMLSSAPASARLQAQARRLAKALGLNRQFELRQSEISQGPLVTGLIRPTIVVPHTFGKTLTRPQQRLALTHELAHIARRDLWSALAALVFRAINWPNPLVHLAAKRFRIDQEAACDATVLTLTNSEPQAYAQTLLACAKSHTKSLPLTSSRLVPALGLTLTHPLKDRIMFLNRNTTPLSRLGLMASAAMIIGGAVISVPVTYAEAHPHDELAGAPHTANSSTKSTRSIMMVDVDDDGQSKTYKFDIRTNNDELTAYRIDTKTGKKTKIKARDIEGFDADKLKEGGWSFQIQDNGTLKFLDASEAHEWARKNPGAQPQMPPMPPSKLGHPSSFSDTRHITLQIDASDMEDLDSELSALKRELTAMGDMTDAERSEVLKSLKSLKSLNRLKSLRDGANGNVIVKRKFLNSDGEEIRIEIGEELGGRVDLETLRDSGEKVYIKRKVIDADGNVTVHETDEAVKIFIDGAKRGAAEQPSEALVQAAQRLLEQAEANSKTTSMSYDAQQKLKAASKALKEAQAALEDN